MSGMLRLGHSYLQHDETSGLGQSRGPFNGLLPSTTTHDDLSGYSLIILSGFRKTVQKNNSSRPANNLQS